jgi:thiosulfate dehydrogenase [quinone] large subunit
MTLFGFVLMLVFAAALAAAGQYSLDRFQQVGLTLLYLFVMCFLGVFAGSEGFQGGLESTGGGINITTISEIGPSVGGFYLLTGLIGGLIMLAISLYGLRQRQANVATDITEYGIRDPQFAHLLFNDIRSAPLWLGVRLFVGYQWLGGGLGKVTNPAWMDSGSALQSFWTKLVYPPEGQKSAIVYGWFANFIRYMLDHGWYTWFGKVVAIGELLVGLGLLVGCLTGIAAFFGSVMNFNFMLAGSASTNPLLFALAILLVLAWKVAGFYGLDRYVLPWLGTPWGPGKAFEPQQEAAAGTRT